MSQAQLPAGAIGDLSGQVIGGRYRLGELLGQGGMGVVYTAVQESLARPIAIKVLQPVLAQSGESLLRFKAEAERAGRLAHPHIVQILDFGYEPGASAWIAMELLRGESLGARIDRGGISEAEVVRIARETLSALEAAHGANLVHRDLKPDNIFLADVPGIGTSVKVLDFGIAKLLDDEAAGKLTATGVLIGTPLYMAPEQARGDDIDQRADLYSLGAVLYETLTGGPPFIGRNYHALLFQVLSETPKPIETYRPDITPALAQVIMRAMAKLPADRWQSAHEMAEALRAVHPSEHVPSMRADDRAVVGTAPTMATPAPQLAATTPAFGGSNAGVLASLPGAQGASPRSGAIPPTRIEPLAQSPTWPITPSPTAPIPQPVKAEGFRWRLFALAGGVMATVAVAFLGGNMMSSRTAAPAAAPPASVAATATLIPMAQPAVPMPTIAGQQVQPPRVAMADPPSPLTRPTAPIAAGTPQPVIAAATLADAPSAAVSTRRAPAKVAPAPRTYPRPSVGYSGGAFPDLPDSSVGRAAMEAEGGWADCWPRDLPAPVMNQGRDFSVEVAGDGHVLSAAPRPNNEEPLPFSSCVVNKLRRLNFGPTTTGEVAHIRVGLYVR